MIGILLMSHGKMAEGILDTSSLFFPEQEKIEALCLAGDDNPECFDEVIKEVASTIDDGSGVVAFCDLFGGTPANRSAYCLNDNLQVITGMNLPMVLELLGQRLYCQTIKDIDIEALLNVGKDGIKHLNEIMKE